MRDPVHASRAVMIVVAVTTLAFFDRVAHGQQKAPEVPSEVPSVISQVKALEVIRWDLVDAGARHAGVVVKIKNNSGKPIIAVTLESGDDKDASGLTLNGIHEVDKTPSVVVKPDETFEIRFALSQVLRGCPIRVAGVFYADGTEDGDEKTLEGMRSQREHLKNKKPEKLPQ